MIGAPHEVQDAGDPRDRERADPSSRPRPPLLLRFWWITAVRGALALALGIAVFYTGTSGERLSTYMGLYWLLGGVLTLRAAFAVRPRRAARLAFAAGSLSVVVALLVLVKGPLFGLLEETPFRILLGVTAVLSGLLRLFLGLRAERQAGRSYRLGGLALGSIEVLLGLVFIVATFADPAALLVLAGLWGLMAGVLLLLESFRLRRSWLVLSSGSAERVGAR